MVDRDKIEAIFRKNFKYKGDFTIDDQGLISCTGDVELINKKFHKLPVKFGKVAGWFIVSKSALRTLEGSPHHCDKFSCNGCKYLTSLEGAPKIVTVGVLADACKLTDLHGCPQTPSLSVDENPILSWQGLPNNLERISVTWKPKLPLLRLLTIKHITLDWSAYWYEAVAPVRDIIYKYMGTNNPGDILRCASELTEHGFEGNAEW